MYVRRQLGEKADFTRTTLKGRGKIQNMLCCAWSKRVLSDRLWIVLMKGNVEPALKSSRKTAALATNLLRISDSLFKLITLMVAAKHR